MAYQPRRYARHETEKLPVTIRIYGTFVWTRGSVINLSQGGVQIYTPAKFMAGNKLELEFNTIDRQGRKNRRKLIVTIVWKRGYKYGCQFDKA